MLHLAVLLLAACGDPPVDLELVLDGPDRVRVDHLGPVVSPKVAWNDGSAADGVVWAVSDGAVARVIDGGIVAEAPGETRVTGTVGDDSVSWTLLVEPAVMLRIEGAPARVGIGDTLALQATASIGDSSVDPGALEWSSSDDDVLDVGADGAATALGVGRVWVTARSAGGASAMVEIDVQ